MTRRRDHALRALALLAVLALPLAFPTAASALTVYAASSLRDAFPRIAGATYSFAGSNMLQLQVERGAPADVFASASPKEAQALYHEGRCTRPVTFATNVLVLLVPKANPGHVQSVYSLRSGGRRLAVGDAGVPIGAYTRKLLARLHLSSILTSNTVSDETNVAGIVSKVALGSADAGFAYVTDGRLAGARVKAIGLPRKAQPPVHYEICAVRRPGADAPDARTYIGRVLGAKGRRILKAAGFGLPPRR